MKYLHTMVRVTDLDRSLGFTAPIWGWKIWGASILKKAASRWCFSPRPARAQIELTHNWDPETLDEGRNFGHLAYEVEDIYATCQKLSDAGIVINRPPRDGRMAFVRSPDNVSIELLQAGDPLPAAEPWASMENTGAW